MPYFAILALYLLTFPLFYRAKYIEYITVIPPVCVGHSTLFHRAQYIEYLTVSPCSAKYIKYFTVFPPLHSALFYRARYIEYLTIYQIPDKLDILNSVQYLISINFQSSKFPTVMDFPPPVQGSDISPERQHSAERARDRAERLAQMTGTDERRNRRSRSGSPVQPGPIPQPVFSHVDNIPQVQFPASFGAPLRNPILPSTNTDMDVDPFSMPAPATRVVNLNDSPPRGRVTGFNFGSTGGPVSGPSHYVGAMAQPVAGPSNFAGAMAQPVAGPSNFVGAMAEPRAGPLSVHGPSAFSGSIAQPNPGPVNLAVSRTEPPAGNQVTDQIHRLAHNYGPPRIVAGARHTTARVRVRHRAREPHPENAALLWCTTGKHYILNTIFGDLQTCTRCREKAQAVVDPTSRLWQAQQRPKEQTVLQLVRRLNLKIQRVKPGIPPLEPPEEPGQEPTWNELEEEKRKEEKTSTEPPTPMKPTPLGTKSSKPREKRRGLLERRSDEQ
ncbi:hypothetical protein FIBSPDRAFT_894128 [Athelia psychrophila]|uniref:Uncharacterized protein n=1 Tax=Athelia psychrophila TaxID=1759441 RepID=A0A166G7K1_9AGAM|nr:hypothetical protein FIBSPDRAFT_894128 [Fibularhizoctonia sp. CBS 109695]